MKAKKISIFTTAIVLCLIALGVILAYNTALPRYDYEPVRVEIPATATDADMPQILTDALGQDYGSAVYRMWKIFGGTAEASHGSYLIEPGQRAYRTARRISRGQQTPLRLTVNNMRTIGDLCSRIALQIEADSASVASALDSVLAHAGFTTATYPTAILPDTYEVYWTATPQSILDRMLKHRNNFWNEDRRARAAAIGLTPEEVHTVASIVEEETNKADERPAVARLYLNRLKQGMMLQADPTVKFAIGDFSLRRITGAHLAIDSPYNTYRNQGLPPGPIRIAEAATVDAVLDAPDHNYLYMCARPDFSGYHNFAADYNRHRINAALYHRALDKRGI